MFVGEYAAKQILAAAGLAIPGGFLARSAAEAETAARELGGAVVVKSQVPAGGRGKAGGIRFAIGPADAGKAAGELLGQRISGHGVATVLVERRLPVDHEYYVAVMSDPRRGCPLVLFSAAGGVDIESAAATGPEHLLTLAVDVGEGLTASAAGQLVSPMVPDARLQAVLAETLTRLYGLYGQMDADLLEVNPLALTTAGDLVALDCKLVVDDGALKRHPELPAPAPAGTELELRAAAQGLLYVDLGGDVGILANGAGLTMATADAVLHHGGRPANFLEVGGDAYKKSAQALSLVLGNPRVKSLLVNLCGAYARTDVIMEGIVAGWRELCPQVPVSFCVHGTGAPRAIEILRTELGMESHVAMDDAVRAAIRLAGAPQRGDGIALG